MKRDVAVKINKGQIIRVLSFNLASMNFIQRGAWKESGQEKDSISPLASHSYFSKPQIPNVWNKDNNTYHAEWLWRLNPIKLS